MNILLVALGASGDVNPTVGLGLRLKRRGHRVTILGDLYYRKRILESDLAFVPVGSKSRYEEVVRGEDLGTLRPRRLGVGSLTFADQIVPTYEAVAAQLVPDETVLVATSFIFGARVANEKLGVPLVTLVVKYTECFRGPEAMPRLPGVTAPAWAPAWYRRRVYRRVTRALDRRVAKPVNAARSALGLPPVEHVVTRWRQSTQCLVGLFPSWLAGTSPPWPEHFHFAGFPLLEAPGAMSDELRSFLDRGRPPIVFSASTVPVAGLASFVRESVAYCRRTGQRAVLSVRFSDRALENLPDHVLHVRYAPFAQLLPRARALVHFGGIGSLSQALRAGIPQVIVPFLPFEQAENAARLERLGVGRGIGVRSYTVRSLDLALGRLLSSPRVSQRCSELARRVNEADGLERAAEVIEGVSPKRSHPRDGPAA